MDRKVVESPKPMQIEILGFYLSDYKAKYHVRELSRNLKKNHRTVSLALQKLVERGVMRHESVGRSEQYFLNLENIVTKEYIKQAESLRLMKLLEKKFLIGKLLTEISDDIENMPLILFGSYAKGEETKSSDIDVIIIGGKGVEKAIKRINEFGSRHQVTMQIRKATPVIFESGLKSSDNLILEILKHHVILNNAEMIVGIFWRYFHG